MRNRRRNWLLRRLVLGLAVAAIVAPTAQARLDEGGMAQSDDGNGVLIQGDDKALVGGGIVAKGPVRGDDKVLAPESDGVVIHGDDKVIVSVPGGDGVLAKDDKVILTPADWQYNQFAYRHGMPQDYRGGDFATQVRDSQPTHGKPVGRQVPVTVTGTGSDFNWGDGLIGAAAALGLALLAYGAARSTRSMGRPATS